MDCPTFDMSSECIKEEAAWEPEYVEGLWAELYADHEVKPDLVLGPETIQAQDIALPFARGCAANASNIQPKNEATQDLEDVTAIHTNHEDAISNMPKTEPTQNTSLEDASASNTPKTVQKQEPKDISTTYASLQEPSVDDDDVWERLAGSGELSIVETSVRNEPSIVKNIKQSLKPCYVKLDRMAYLEPIAYRNAFICQICQKICSHKHNLMIHILCHTQDEIKSIKTEKKLIKKGKFNRHFCGKTLSQKQKLVKHMKSHTEKLSREQMLKDRITKTTYICDICGMSTVRKTNLIKHLKRHAKGEAFACEVCKKRFRVAWELVDHIKLASCEPHNKTFMINPPYNKRILPDLVLKSCYVSLEHIETENAGSTVKTTINETVDMYSGSEDLSDELKSSSMGALVRRRPKKFSCDSCSKRFRCHAKVVTHARCHTDKKLCTCDVCKDLIKVKATHNITKRATEKIMNLNRVSTVSCSTCNSNFAIKSELINRNIKIHDSKVNYKACKERDIKNLKSCNLVKHIRTQSDLKKYECTVCESKFIKNSSLKVHLRSHTGEKPYKCTVCDSKFSKNSSLKVHLRSHTGEKPYKCTVCDSKFRETGVLKQHMRIHSEEKPFKCTVCDSKFSRGDTLKHHMRSHSGEKPYKCTVCNSTFSKTSSLKIHLRIHTGEKPYKCTVCDSKFYTSWKLKVHMRIHSGEKPYKCTVCDSKFSKNRSLKVHLKFHTGEKPYKCTVCDSNFRERCTLKQHMRMHSGEKPYECTVCGLKFYTSNKLKVHMRIHSGEKPYECTVCDSKFRRSGALKIHMRTHSV